MFLEVVRESLAMVWVGMVYVMAGDVSNGKVVCQGTGASSFCR